MVTVDDNAPCWRIGSDCCRRIRLHCSGAAMSRAILGGIIFVCGALFASALRYDHIDGVIAALLGAIMCAVALRR